MAGYSKPAFMDNEDPLKEYLLKQEEERARINSDLTAKAKKPLNIMLASLLGGLQGPGAKNIFVEKRNNALDAFDQSSKRNRDNMLFSRNIDKENREMFIDDFDRDRRYSRQEMEDQLKAEDRALNKASIESAQDILSKRKQELAGKPFTRDDLYKVYNSLYGEDQDSESRRRFNMQMYMKNRDLAENNKKERPLSVAEQKQRGLVELGMKAYEQYNKATSGKDGYNPTKFQAINQTGFLPNILKDDKAVEAFSAQDAWVEGFLRDASGAAIPPSERGAYAKDFFPQPGDSENVIENKRILREQKMRNAAMAGRMDPDSLDFSGSGRTSVSRPSQMVKVLFKGKQKLIPQNRLQDAIDDGAKLVE